MANRFAWVMTIALVAAVPARAQEIPKTEPQLFEQLFAMDHVPAHWIIPAAHEELPPELLAKIIDDLRSKGGAYSGADKTASGWLIRLDRGDVRSRIVRSKDGRIVGVFFSDLE